MTFLSAMGILSSIVQVVVVATVRPGASRTVSALILYVGALVLFWWTVPHAAEAQLNIAFTKVEPVNLLVTGPYAYVRHPFYASYLLYWIAGALVSSWLWTSVFVMGSCYFVAMDQEEKGFQLSPLAVSYATYKHKTGALFPILQFSKRKTSD